MSMKTDDFVRAIDSLAPGGELRDRILQLEQRPRRARLERPGRLMAAFAAAAIVCVCVVAAMLLLNRGGAPDDGRAVGPVNTPTFPVATASPSAPAQSSATASTDTPAPTATPPGVKKTLPEGIVAPADAVAIAKQAYMDYFGIDAEDCVLVDEFSYSVSTIYGTTDVAPTIVQSDYDGKEILDIMFVGDENAVSAQGAGSAYWYFQFLADVHTEDVQLTLDAMTGKVVFGSLHGYGSERRGYGKKELEQRTELAKQYAQKTAIADGAAVLEAENLKDDSDVAVTMSDGRVITVTLDKDRAIQGFSIRYP